MDQRTFPDCWSATVKDGLKIVKNAPKIKFLSVKNFARAASVLVIAKGNVVGGCIPGDQLWRESETLFVEGAP